MVEEFTPFVPPDKEVANEVAPEFAFPTIIERAPSHQGPWKFGDLLVVSKVPQLPARCIKCNAAGTNRMTQTYTWHPGLLYLTIPAGLIVYVILAMLLSKSVKVDFVLCPSCQASRKTWFGFGVFLLVGCVLLAFLGMVFGVGAPVGRMQDFWLYGIIVGFVGAFVGVLLIGSSTQVLAARKIDDRIAQLAGAGKAFLGDFPDWPGR